MALRLTLSFVFPLPSLREIVLPSVPSAVKGQDERLFLNGLRPKKAALDGGTGTILVDH